MDPLLQELEAEHKADLEKVKPVHVVAGIACVVPIVFGIGWVFSTGELTLAEYRQAGSAAIRSYLIEGEVEAAGAAAFYAIYIDDTEMHLCRITDGEETATVWYNPKEFPDPPKEGDHVRIKLHFETILSTMIGQGTRYKTYGIADDIEVTEPAGHVG